ncbi:S8 family peptidase [Nitrososphaera sp.]|uniref:S8 family peptidase n=1 Tax=Nitrososphaera sp. TaxID=1971748 RepID=UPI00307EB9E0
MSDRKDNSNNNENRCEKKRKISCTLVLAALLLAAALASSTAVTFLPAASAASGNDDDDDGDGGNNEQELLVKFKDGVRLSSERAVHRSINASVVDTFPELGIDVVAVPDGYTAGEAAEHYESSGLAEYAEAPAVRKISAIPRDPDFARQWGLDDASGGNHDIDAPEAWEIAKDCSGVIVATVDTGMDYMHEDLKGSYAAGGLDLVNGDDDPMDDNGHGTHVAGIMGATGDNGVGVSGVCWDARIVAFKVFDASGAGSTSDVVDAVDRIVRLKERGADIRVVNMSFGGKDYSQAEYDALRALRDAGILVVASAGNERLDNDGVPNYPSGYDLDNIISVAASDNNDMLASFSNRGAKSVDMAAPGVGILSTYSRSGRQGYEELSGTSMAAPYVSGVAALVASHDPSLGYLEVKRRILEGADRVSGLDGLVAGSARLDAHGALGGAAGNNNNNNNDDDTQLTLTVKSVDLGGNPIAGMWSTVKSRPSGEGGGASAAIVAQSKFTPASFVLGGAAGGNGGSGSRGPQTYSVTAHDYRNILFDHWEDGSKARTRTISSTATNSPATSESEITAYYKVSGASKRGFTPLAYAGEPPLQVRAVLLSGDDGGGGSGSASSGSAKEQQLAMWAIIEPAGPNKYTVTVHNYKELAFDHWEDGTTERTRVVQTESGGGHSVAVVTAYYHSRIAGR